MKHLGITEIKEIIPHRHPFLLVDYIEDYEPGEYAIGYKCVTYREDFFAGKLGGAAVGVFGFADFYTGESFLTAAPQELVAGLGAFSAEKFLGDRCV